MKCLTRSPCFSRLFAQFVDEMGESIKDPLKKFFVLSALTEHSSKKLDDRLDRMATDYSKEMTRAKRAAEESIGMFVTDAVDATNKEQVGCGSTMERSGVGCSSQI